MRFTGRRNSRQDRRAAGFTLVEILASLAVGCLLLLGVALIAVMSAKVMRKNVLAGDAVTASRLVQEHLNHELSMAVSDDTRPNLMPQYRGSNGATPPRFSRITYRVVVGNANAVVVGGGTMGDNHVTLRCPPDLTPQIGDYLMLDRPDFGPGAAITTVTDNRGSGGDVEITLAQSVLASTVGIDTLDIPNGAPAILQRQRAYQVEPSTRNPGLFEMRWYYSTSSVTPPLPGDTDPYVIITSNVDPAAQYPFLKVPGPGAQPDVETAIGWEFTYATASSEASGPYAGGKRGFYESNHSEGMIMPKSGNPKSTESIVAPVPITTSTITSSTSIPTTTSITSTSTTSTTSSTSTTSTSTTSTSTTSTSTTSTSTTSTSTSSTSTSTSTSTSSTSTSSTSTSSTSTTSTSTSSSTSTSTSTTSTSTSSTSTTSTSTSTSTSTTSTSTSTTSTTSTSTTSISTTSTSTSIPTTSTSTTSTSTSTSTTIDYDG